MDLGRLVKVRWGRGLLFFGWGMGNRVAGLPEGTFSGSIDFQMHLPWELAAFGENDSGFATIW